MTAVTNGNATADLAGKVQEATDGAKQAVSDVAGQAQQTLKTQIDQRSTAAGETATSVAHAVRNASGDLRSQGQDLPARVIEQGADRVEQLGTYLRQSNADTILRDVEDFARKQPWAVILGGIAIGFAASRFLKASSSRRYEASRGRQPSSAGTPAMSSVPSAAPPVSSPRSPWPPAPDAEPLISPSSGAPYPPGGAPPIAPPVEIGEPGAPLQRAGNR